MVTQIAEQPTLTTYVGFDENSERHIHLFKYNAEQFNQLAKLVEKTGKMEGINGLFIFDDDTLKKINTLKWNQTLNINSFGLVLSPLFTEETKQLIKKSIRHEELVPFKLILSNQLYNTNDMFKIDRKKSIEEYRYYSMLIKNITNTKPKIKDGKLIVSAKSLMKIHAYTGINPNTFFTNNNFTINNLDWTGIHKYKL
jgi:hypothetical protein